MFPALTGGPLTSGPPGKPSRPLEYHDKLKMVYQLLLVPLALVGPSTWGFIERL